MKTEQRLWTKKDKWSPEKLELGEKAQLVFVFGETSLLKDPNLIQEVKREYPKAHLFGCSTSGEIHGARVFDNTVSTTAVQFEKTQIKPVSLTVDSADQSFQTGEKLAQALDKKDLAHVLVLSIGLNINGSELVKGLTSALPSNVKVTGGLAGDQDRFQETVVVAGENVSNNIVAAVGLYGSQIKVGSASLGGWDPFGPERLITKSKSNVLFELDGKSALELYKHYLGSHAKDLPGSALLFPLSLRTASGESLVRTVLAVDDKSNSMTFAGDVPEGSYVRFMKANFDRLIDGAIGAAEKSATPLRSSPPELALLISCVGRKLVLKQRVEEEVEGVRDIFGVKTALTGFYSYGEISPFTPNAKCELHNQTMTITTLTESDVKAA